MWVYLHSANQIKGSVTLDRSSRAAYHMLAEGVGTASYMNTTGLEAANDILAERVCTASCTRCYEHNFAVLHAQLSLAQQQRAISHFLRQQQLFSIVDQTKGLLSPLLRRGLSHHRLWSTRVVSTWQQHERCPTELSPRTAKYIETLIT